MQQLHYHIIKVFDKYIECNKNINNNINNNIDTLINSFSKKYIKKILKKDEYIKLYTDNNNIFFIYDNKLFIIDNTGIYIIYKNDIPLSIKKTNKDPYILDKKYKKLICNLLKNIN